MNKRFQKSENFNLKYQQEIHENQLINRVRIQTTSVPRTVVGHNVDRQNVDRQNVVRHNVQQTKCRQTKCRRGKMSTGKMSNFSIFNFRVIVKIHQKLGCLEYKNDHNSRNKNLKFDFSFGSAHSASSI